MIISKFREKSIYKAYCINCSLSSQRKCCCVVRGQIEPINLLNCPHRVEIEKMIYGTKPKDNE